MLLIGTLKLGATYNRNLTKTLQKIYLLLSKKLIKQEKQNLSVTWSLFIITASAMRVFPDFRVFQNCF